MTVVYHPANLVEAQLAADELSEAGIACEVTGQYLSGAIGELPPTEVLGIRIVDPAHEQQAKRVLADWEITRRRVREDWFCRQCGEQVGGAFGACWQCGSAAPSA